MTSEILVLQSVVCCFLSAHLRATASNSIRAPPCAHSHARDKKGSINSPAESFAPSLWNFFFPPKNRFPFETLSGDIGGGKQTISLTRPIVWRTAKGEASDKNQTITTSARFRIRVIRISDATFGREKIPHRCNGAPARNAFGSNKIISGVHFLQPTRNRDFPKTKRKAVSGHVPSRVQRLRCVFQDDYKTQIILCDIREYMYTLHSAPKIPNI
ncbi:hypothetical protein CDAR_59801 [Caerostris darwini]|uniref:Secreted protein n=1 Tax=Caerostris darwini TaxID=1538125 RepID=A0AAV4RPE4_9ARAC|nr:hypothetical protein CDAR_59801 [Caerostris darwini]